MKKILKVFLTIALFSLPKVLLAQAPNLGSAANFVLFSSIGPVTGTGVNHLTGNVGTNNGASSGFTNVDGVLHDMDAASALCATDLLAAYNQLDTTPSTAILTAILGNGDTLVAGVYKVLSAASLNLNLILNAQGNANAVFIFQIQGAFSTNTSSKIKLINGAQACNVFWKVEGLVDMAAGTTMKGTVIANNAAINMAAGDTLEGRALSTTGAVSVNGTTAFMPTGCGSSTPSGPTAPTLNSIACYAIFTGNGTVSNSGSTTVFGDVGTNVGTTAGYSSSLVTGTVHLIPDGSTGIAATDLSGVYTYLNGLTYDIQLMSPALFGNNLVLTPHTYLLNAATTLTDTLYLNAENDTNAVFVIQINGAFATTINSRVLLINGTRAKNIFWNIEGAATINDNSIFNGTIVVHNAAILLNTGAIINGRALSTNGAITTTAVTLTANTIPTAGSLTGTGSVFIGSTITLAHSVSGGTWVSGNTHATVSGGIVTGVSAGIDTISYIVSNLCGADTVTKAITILGFPNVCVGANLTVTDIAVGGVWSSSNSNATIAGGVITGVSAGADTIRYIVTSSCSADTATIAITINPLPVAASITGTTYVVCAGSTITLNDATGGGTWSSGTIGVATINSSGIVTGVVSGTALISYSVINSCGTDVATTTITVNPLPVAGTITGTTGVVCAGSTITMNDVTGGGTWNSGTIGVATVNSSGIVSGVASGTSLISYSVINSCGTDVATTTITVNPLPVAGTITGTTGVVCAGSTITMNDVTGGGTWNSGTIGVATVNSSGIVSGVASGTSLISYSVTNSCGTDVATMTVTVNPLPVAASITGTTSVVCAGSTISLNDATGGGTWSSGTIGVATVNSIGIVSGVASGTSLISYSVTNSCGTDVATTTISVSPLPVAASITGTTSVVCAGSTITMNDVTGGGTWNSGTIGVATVNSSGIVSGVASGTSLISYSVTNSCGTDVATMTVTVNPLPVAASITGTTSVVCAGSTITLNDATGGGTWSSGTIGVATINSSGIVTGVVSGTALISYSVINSCGTDVATSTITVNPLPVAGTIIGGGHVCIGTFIILTDAVTGGTWIATNANATVSAGNVSGLLSGIDTIKYIVSNMCGTDTSSKIINVNPLPYAGTISGVSSVCIGSSITLTDVVTGGVWNRSNTNATVVGGVVTGISAGSDTIGYRVTNICGSVNATLVITVDPLPDAGVITY